MTRLTSMPTADTIRSDGPARWEGGCCVAARLDPPETHATPPLNNILFQSQKSIKQKIAG